MFSKFIPSLFAVCVLSLLTITNTPASTLVTYSATDLPDSTPNEDLWHYDYQITGAFNEFEGITLLFNSLSYQYLHNINVSDSVSWNLTTLQPDINLGDGYINALALTNINSSLVLLSTDFIWLNTGSPDSQPFEIHDSLFQVVETGITQAVVVPIPGTLILNLSGLVLVARRFFRLNRTNN